MTTPRLSWFTRPGARALQALIDLNRLIDRKKTPAELAPYCCHLALPASSDCYSRCISRGGDWWIQYWWCCQGSARYQCQECTTSNDCYNGPFWCSNAVQGPSC